jgi:adenosylcobinamide-GDP ribazoletransferase
MRSLLLAFQFLTILPLRREIEYGPQDFAHSLRWFFLVGLFVGALQFFTALLLNRLHVPHAWSSLIVVALGFMISGGLHIDGVADVADGFGAGYSRESILRIMADQRLGVFAMSAIFLLLYVKIQATREVFAEDRMQALLIGPVIARSLLATICTLVPYAKEQGKGKLFAAGSFFRDASISLSCCVFLVFPITDRSWIAFACSTAVTVAFAAYCYFKIRGFTGDTLGCHNELAEIATLLTF